MAAAEAQEQVQGLARQAQQRRQGLMQQLQQHKPTSSQVVGFMTFVVGAGVVGVALAVVAPLLLLLSPVLVPLGFLLALCTAGALLAAGMVIAAVSAAAWVYKYVKGRHPAGSQQLDEARCKARDLAPCSRGEAAPGA